MKNPIIIKPADACDSHLIAELAQIVWTEHYVPIIGREQVEYMLEKFQSAKAIENQIKNEGYLYYLAYLDGITDSPAGYMAILPDFRECSLFLSKLYVDRRYRRKGIAKAFMETARSFCRRYQLSHIWLTVNKYNSSSIAAYEKLGFSIVEDIVTDIGNGFVMDDFKMRMEIS